MADETKFTKGPWSIEIDAGVHQINDAAGDWVCECTAEGAHLIAAAPELVAALFAVTDTYWGVDDDHAGDGGEPSSMIVQARIALAKARGEPTPHP